LTKIITKGKNMKNNTPEIRPPKNDEEIAAAVAILAGSDPWMTLGMKAGEIKKRFYDPMLESFVVLHGREVIGTATIQMKGACTGYIKSLAVKEGWRNQRTGSRLMDFLEEKIFSVLPNVFLCVSSFNGEAKRFYMKRGYEEIGVLKDFTVKGYDEIFMRKTTGPLFG